jgi:DNA-binding XRE family transcriptional regulator
MDNVQAVIRAAQVMQESKTRTDALQAELIKTQARIAELMTLRRQALLDLENAKNDLKTAIGGLV